MLIVEPITDATYSLLSAENARPLLPAIFAPVAIVVSTGAMAALSDASVAGSSLQPERINVAKKNPMRESFSNGCLNVLMSLVPYFFDSLGRDKARWVFIFCLMVEAGYKAVYGV